MATQNEHFSNCINVSAEVMFVSNVFSSRMNGRFDQVHLAEAGHPVHDLLFMHVHCRTLSRSNYTVVALRYDYYASNTVHVSHRELSVFSLKTSGLPLFSTYYCRCSNQATVKSLIQAYTINDVHNKYERSSNIWLTYQQSA
jgi:hypothetical protein